MKVSKLVVMEKEEIVSFDEASLMELDSIFWENQNVDPSNEMKVFQNVMFCSILIKRLL